MVLAAFVIAVVLGTADDPAPVVFDTLGDDAVQEVILLAEDRPVFLRLRIAVGEGSFRSAWDDSARAFFTLLDRDGDGRLDAKEANREAIVALLRLIVGESASLPRGRSDGTLSFDQLSELLGVAMGPFRVEVGRVEDRRTDALFDHLDRDKDGALTRPELERLPGSLRRLDLNDDERISRDELEPFRSPTADAATARRTRPTASPPAIELVPGESPLRVVRALVRKYDRASPRLDGKLSPGEFAIDKQAFEAADRDGDGLLDADEVRQLVERPPLDFVLDVAFPAEESGRSAVETSGGSATGRVRRLGPGHVEGAFGHVRADFQFEDPTQVDVALIDWFKAADRDKDGSVSEEEAGRNVMGRASPIAGLFRVADRDGDGKIVTEELQEFGRRLAEAARGHIVLAVSDHGRSLFGILDADRDGALGARETLRAIERVVAWDADGDGRITAEEVPDDFEVTLGRGRVAGISQSGRTVRDGPGRGPTWFRRMDRNRDGDVSRREFLGSREKFDRLDRDHDGLIDPDEAAIANGPPQP
jgi:Ca2+-binding EF-hand superfamily protein